MRWYAQAVNDYTASLNVKPSDADTLHNRALAYRLWGRLDEALADINVALEANPNAENYTLRANTYRAKKDAPKALRDYTSAVRLDDGFFNAYFERAGFCEEMGDVQCALRDYKRAIALGYVHRYYLTVGTKFILKSGETEIGSATVAETPFKA